MKKVAQLWLTMALTACCMGQGAATAHAHFAVVSIKRDPPNFRLRYRPPGSPGPVYPGGKYSDHQADLFGLLAFAYPEYSVPGDTLVGLPSWAANRSGLYDVRAEAATGERPSLAQMRQMMQSLLAERFLLKYHITRRVESVYILQIASSGVRNITPSSHGDGHVALNLMLGRSLSGAEGRAVTMGEIAARLAFGLRRPIVDRTGMKGTYDVRVKRVAPPGLAGGGNLQNAIISAVRDKLGLDLSRGKASIRVMVIDSVHRPTPNL